MKSIGRHLIAEFYGCEVVPLDDVELIRKHMLAAADVIGATVMGHTFHRYVPHGVSGTVVIAESHLSIHTWPENGYVAVDIYTCGGLDPRPGFDYLGRVLCARSARFQEILRGLPEDIDEQAQFLPEDVKIITRIATQVDFP